ncbi:MAG: glycoside hydrolase family 9 protein [Oscillospiraceae bacterium]|nr:glycoside hydrolase family 9 protein [Oscillospiraceae bacterium]
MHKRIGKVVTASLMAATMLTTATVGFIAPMSASAGNMVGQSTFDEGIGLPWHTCETNPAKQHFDIDGGSYNVHIDKNKGSEGRWDLQLRHRGLKIQAGHQYKVSGEITADADGYIYSKIGNYKGDVEIWHNLGNGEWQPVQLKKGQTYKFSDTFTASQSLEVAEWAFHYADNQGAYGNNDTGMPDGSTIKFDNLCLECTTCGSTSGEGCNFDLTDEFGVITPHSNVRLNQVGYFEKLNKKATYVTDSTSALDFAILDASGKEVYTGKTVPKGKDEDSGENCHIIDFSDFNTGGEGYTIQVKETVSPYVDKAGRSYDLTVSHPFNIANTVYDGMLTNALNYYYQNRSGINIESAYITSGDKTTLAHIKGHDPDKAWVQSDWVKSYGAEFDGDKQYQIDGTGGWYDAGDHGKYVVNGGISVWTLQNMYEYAKSVGKDAKFADNQTMVIPENSNNAPDILDEARYELEWMFKMIVDSKDPYYGSKYNGMVYHKLHDHKWTGLATRPYDYEEEWGTTRIVKPPTTAATLNLSATAAQAARLWKGIDDEFAAKCLAIAKSTYEAAKKNPAVYAPMDQAIGGGAYGDTYVEDDFYWAACELYATTGDSSYYDELKGYKNEAPDDKAFSLTTNLGGGENNGSFSSFNWGCTAGLGTLTLYLSDNTSEADKATIVSNIKTAADSYVAEQEKQAMGIPYHGATFQDPVNIGEGIDVTGYEWGSNSFVVNNAIVMAYAYDATGDSKYLNGASEAMDYIFGRNGLGFSYVTGYGTYHLQYPHHRYWSYGLDKSFPMAPAGVMSGGPGAGMQDPYIQGLGYKRGTLPSQKCFVDNAESWSTNEVTINWNAPFAWVVSFLEDAAPGVSIEDKLVVQPSSVNVAVGETEKLVPTINGSAVDATFSSSDDSIAKVGADGTVTGVAAGSATITVSAGGQTVTVKVTVTSSSTQTDPTNATDPTKATDPTNSTGVNPSADTDPTSIANAHWGDTNVDGDVSVSDVVKLNTYLLNPTANPLTDQGFINANCMFDNAVDSNDSSLIMNYVAMIISYDKLGPQPQ